MSDEESLNVSSNTKIGMPLRNLLAIVGSVAAGVLGYSELENRIGDIETSQTLMAASLESVSKWSDSLQTGETSTSATQELFLLLEVTSSQLDALEKQIIEGKAVSINQQQELTLGYLVERMSALEAKIESNSAKLESKIETLRDKWAEMKARNGVH
tara:strand:- start:770 stop:1240 length:471 start_codon:yes stop_codon:yes gene_type:complete